MTGLELTASAPGCKETGGDRPGDHCPRPRGCEETRVTGLELTASAPGVREAG